MTKPAFIRARLRRQEKARARKSAGKRTTKLKNEKVFIAKDKHVRSGNPKTDSTFQVPIRDKSKDPKFKLPRRLISVQETLNSNSGDYG